MDPHVLEAAGDKGAVEDVAFLPKVANTDVDSEDCKLLSKEDLIRIDSEEPVWRRVRIALIALFWVVWFGLILASALFIALTPRCPPRPHQEFWQSKVGYWLDPFAFKDSNGDLVGDLKGLIENTGYIEEQVGAGFVILGSLSPIFPPKIFNNGPQSFGGINSALGSMDDFTATVRSLKKRGMQTIITLNFNSVPLTHELAKAPYLKKASPEDKFSRVGPEYKVLVNGIEYYSTYGNESGLVDLDLTSTEVKAELENATRFWLSKGVDGILLADSAFYVKEGICNGAAWDTEFPSCKLFTPGTASVIKSLRKVVDEISAASSRHKVLIADPGNTGFPGALREHSEVLLGNETDPGAHLIISRMFAENNGAKQDLDIFRPGANPSLTGRLALVTSSPDSKTIFTVSSTSAVFLTPATSIIYAASELGQTPSCDTPPVKMYPFGEKPLVGSFVGRLPVPWNSAGTGFSNSADVETVFLDYITSCGIAETMESSLAAGRGPTMFNLTTSLARLRGEHPSLLWGDFKDNLNGTMGLPISVYKRSAVGFDAVIVASVRSGAWSGVLDLSAECSELTPLLVYPPNEFFSVGTKLSSNTIYITSTTAESLYVFKCAA